jgi:hypothetical protein
MAQTLDQLVEMEAMKPGATRLSVRVAIERYAGAQDQISQSAQSSSQIKKECRERAARVGRILYYSDHYAPTGVLTPADLRLCEIATRVPRQ